MKLLIGSLIVLAVVSLSGIALGKTVEEYVKEARMHQNSGNLELAVETMEKALEEYPENSTCHAFLGLFIGMQAGRTQDVMEAGRLSARSFELLDRAVLLDPKNQYARLYRGLMSVYVPEFLGKLDGGIKDLEFLIGLIEDSPGEISNEYIITAYDLLGTGYSKKGELEKARLAWGKLIEQAPGTDQAREAAEKISKLPSGAEGPGIEKKKTDVSKPSRPEKDTGIIRELVKSGKDAFDTGDYAKAEEVLKEAIGIDPDNADANKLLGLTIARMAEKGYDERIALNTDLRTGLVFESIGYLDRAVELAPEDIELRLIRGAYSIYFPFFAGKHDQGVADLNLVLQSDVPDSTRAQALYLLGVAHQRKAMSYWIEVANKYPDSEAARLVYNDMRPDVKRIDPSEYKAPFLVIDFVLGFRDELPPQTAIWIEDGDGNHVRTIYVSGFSGYVKENQVVLPIWAESSKFQEVDAVTGASIDVGHHVYIWDLKDRDGKKVKSGTYTVKVEASYWPSMKYQLVMTDIKVGKKSKRVVVEEGDLIPYMEVKYLPKNVKW